MEPVSVKLDGCTYWQYGTSKKWKRSKNKSESKHETIWLNFWRLKDASVDEADIRIGNTRTLMISHYLLGSDFRSKFELFWEFARPIIAA